MPLNYDSLPTQLLTLLQAGHQITVHWDCGGDESFVTTLVDGVVQEQNLGADYYDYILLDHLDVEVFLSRITNLAVLLNGYLTEFLRLPSVGEFTMRGDGTIFLDGASLVLEYQSEASSWEDEQDPIEWLPEYYLSVEELANLFPDRLGVALAAPESPTRQADLKMSTSYSGRDVLFHLAAG
jgi:hypothetical protein